MDQLRTSPDGNEGGRVSASRVEAQNAAQWLVRMTRSFASSFTRPDGDIGLRWCRETRTIVTPEIASNTTLELSLSSLTFQFLEHGKPSPHALDPDGKSSTEIEAWLLVEMLHRAFDREAFTKSLPYRMPHLMTGDETKYNPQSMTQELEQLNQRMSDAADVLLIIRAQLQSEDSEAQLVCWPNNLDLGFTVPLWEPSAEAERVRVGYTHGDDNGLSPGFYVRRDSASPTIAKAVDLPCRRIAEDAMTQTSIVEAMIAAFKKIRTSAAH